MTTEEEQQIEQEVFESFAKAHPHETYETWPDRFWQFFHRLYPNVSREDLERTLAETAKSDS